MAEEEIKNTTATKAPEAAKAEEAKKAVSKKAKKGKRIVTSGQMHINATFNNTIISFSDKSGEVLAASSAGANGFRGSKKGTAYAAQIAAEKAAEIVKKEHGMNSVDVYVKGIGLGRDSAIRAVSTVGMKIDSITDVTPIAHGGVRPKGERKP
ncbi:30S ribosomal protein S11 [Candidatus Saccharibacteria bacterium]|nr:30S ribosomal protein S11 [Candidatus Saccharibacteria bacterium]MBR2989429.1 30S ribosomal protein S11 [Candidatus Saccharibacteria bacterium]